MVCHGCGRSVGASSAFCEVCGTRLGGGVHTLTPLPPPPANSSGAGSAGLTSANLPDSTGPEVDDQTRLSAVQPPSSSPPEPDEDQTRFSADADATSSGPEFAPPRPEDGPLAVGQSFGVRYHIIRLLGIGGMGAVYQAWDAELGVAVAHQGHPPGGHGGSDARR